MKDLLHIFAPDSKSKKVRDSYFNIVHEESLSDSDKQKLSRLRETIKNGPCWDKSLNQMTYEEKSQFFDYLEKNKEILFDDGRISLKDTSMYGIYLASETLLRKARRQRNEGR